jgi:hypothetical protein
MKNLSPKGIVIGGVVDVLLSFVFGAVLVIYVIATRGVSASDVQLSSSIMAAIEQSWALYSAHMLIGYGCSVLGGYIAARLSRESLLVNGALASWLCVGFGIYILLSGTAVGSSFTRYVSIPLTPLCYLLGAFLRKRRLHRLRLLSSVVAKDLQPIITDRHDRI